MKTKELENEIVKIINSSYFREIVETRPGQDLYVARNIIKKLKELNINPVLGNEVIYDSSGDEVKIPILGWQE